jgi:hypothetical protein
MHKALAEHDFVLSHVSAVRTGNNREIPSAWIHLPS